MPKIAGYELHTIETGRFGLDGGAMFGIVPKPLWSRHIPADDQNRIPMNMRCLLLVGNGRVILVDTGLGDKYDAKFAQIFNIQQEHSELRRSLAAVGLSVEEVTDVVPSHLHFDHAGGMTTRKGDALTTTFPNARYHVQKTHWEWAMGKPNARERNSFLAENLEPLAQSGQMNLIEGDQELFPGVFTWNSDGHTPAMQMIKVTDGAQTVLFTADVLPTSAHMPTVWGMGYDLDPLKMIDEKAHVLKLAAENNWQIFYDHDPFVEISDVHLTERGFVPAHKRSLAEL